MELMAVIEALRALKRPCIVNIYTDSQYVQKGISEWITAGRRAAGRPPTRSRSRTPTSGRSWTKPPPHQIEWHWVRGHNGHPGNERADALANRGVEAPDQYLTRRLQSRPMRQIVLDTETTGLNHATGDRLIEIGCVELVNRRLTGRHLHFYVNPERDIPEDAMAVHGLTADFLADKPKFAEVVTRSATSCRTPN
jgi:hypothetical protein